MMMQLDPSMLDAEPGMLTGLRRIRRRPPGPSTLFPKLAMRKLPRPHETGQAHRGDAGSIAMLPLCECGTDRGPGVNGKRSLVPLPPNDD
jgi:hypothetical protein